MAWSSISRTFSHSYMKMMSRLSLRSHPSYLAKLVAAMTDIRRSMKKIWLAQVLQRLQNLVKSLTTCFWQTIFKFKQLKQSSKHSKRHLMAPSSLMQQIMSRCYQQPAAKTLSSVVIALPSILRAPCQQAVRARLQLQFQRRTPLNTLHKAWWASSH